MEEAKKVEETTKQYITNNLFFSILNQTKKSIQKKENWRTEQQQKRVLCFNKLTNSSTF